MQLTPVERLILLKLTQVLEKVDPTSAAQHDSDAQALELGREAEIDGLFDVLDLQPIVAMRPRPVLQLINLAE
jgi:hypothetical protein